MRTQTEIALKDDFDQRAFHDFILERGLLPAEILKKAVMEKFLPAQRSPAATAA